MRILVNSNLYSNNNFYNTKPKSAKEAASGQNVQFRSVWNFFKTFRKPNVIEYLSYDKAAEYIKSAVSTKDVIDENLILFLCRKYGDKKDVYSKNLIDKSLMLINEGGKYSTVYECGKSALQPLNIENTLNSLIALNRLKYPKKYAPKYIDSNFKSAEQAKMLLHLRDEAIKNRDNLSYEDEIYDDDKINELILHEPQKTLNMLKVLGEKSFVNVYKEGYDVVEEYILTIGELNSINTPYYEELIKITNPRESQIYKETEDKVRDLKSNYWGVDIDKKELIKKINTLTHNNRMLLNDSVKELEKQLEIAYIFYFLQNCEEDMKRILPYLNPKTKVDKFKYEKLLNYFILTDNNGDVCKKLNFRKNKYLSKLYTCDCNFYINYAKMLTILNKDKDKTIAEIFNDLPQNIKTKKQFKKAGINYNRWITQRQNCFIEKDIKLENGKIAKIHVQKADMNNVEHALFLGNDASCCTAVGSGSNQWTAPTYVMNKMFSCIEIKDGKEFVGNTMCYIADIGGKPALILDNIELKQKYRYNDEIRNAIFEFAKKFTRDLKKPDMPIFLDGNHHRINVDALSKEEHAFSLLGVTGKDEVYLDFDMCDRVLDGSELFLADLYRIQ